MVPLNRNRSIHDKRNHIPLKPDFSLTIHKSQGGTFDEIVYKYSKVHSKPLVYVALSRVTAQERLHIVPTNGRQRIYHGIRKSMLTLRNEFTRLSTVHLATIDQIMSNKMNGGVRILFSLNCQSLQAYARDFRDGDRFNSCQVIYSQFGLAIHQNDHQARRRFVEWAQNEIAVVPDFHKRILFSDEAHFWLNGYVNKQNCRIGSEANPQVYVETPLHPEKLTVNGDWYRAMITNFFIPELNNHDVQELWFQQDGAICHTARATIDLLKDSFGDRLISRFGPVIWPPRSCDLTPLDYFLWGYVKSLVYADKPQTLDYLEDNIPRVIADIRPQMLEKVIENWTSRLDYIRASRGSHMPEIIFKIVKNCCAKNCFCGKPHNRLIHFPKPDKESVSLNQTVQRSVLNPLADVFGGPGGSNCVVPPQGGNEENKSFVATSFLKNEMRTVLLSSVQCFLRDKYDLLHEVRAFLDVGSQSNFITKDCADRLQLKNERINLLVSCLNESTMTINGGVTTSIFNGDLSFKRELNLLVVRRITDLTPSQILNVSLDMPNEIKLADYKFNIPGKIDVFLGTEIFYELLRPGQIYCGDSRLLLQNSVFGYVVSGSVGDEVRDNNIYCGLIRDSDLNTTLRSFWELESIGVKNENCSSKEDVSFEMFKQRVHFKNDRYEVELPWKRDFNELSDNFSLAKRRLGSLMRKMQRDKVLYSEYCKVLKNYLDEGIIEKVTNLFIPTNNPVFYLPHQVIIKNESFTTKLRLVFDASAHEEKQLSLNDCLFHGVNLNPNILDLLISFRSNKIAVLADVEKAFLQISLAPKR
ncbi:DUF1758 domain-containing protein [Trichonephila clavipes]|nr:DUF1758 domain-containing protein [Trichonephila clavipes]